MDISDDEKVEGEPKITPMSNEEKEENTQGQRAQAPCTQ